ncbi:LVIVD repeat-containing protein [Halomicrococcus sp. SG-WS-1]|uniref:LVIVD repeat-containing protein n=1 Tax=Halomicrococcus sp. SG-WS-1 TaxID=3439057 RepID=UPI003F794115
MTFDRRSFLKATGTVLGTTALPAGAASASEWRYDLVGEALDPGTQEVDVQGDYAYTAQSASIATVDLSDPSTPLLAGTATGEGTDNVDAKVDGDVAGLANDGDPGGVTFFDVSDPTTPTRVSFYEAASGVHNLFIDGDYAYLCINDDFAHSRMVVVDVSDPANPVSLEGDERGSGGAWMLRDAHEDMAEAGVNPIHDIWVQNDLAYMCFWDAGVVVADVSDPTDPTAVAHFGAADDAGEKPADTAERYRRYLGGHETNAHYVQPTPSGDYTFVGAETFPGPFEDTVVPGDHGGIRVFDTSDVSASSTPSNPYEDHVAYVPAPEQPDGALSTSHNFDVTDSKLFASFYQGGVRAYDIDDPTDPQELAAFAPDGTAYWGARVLPTDGPRHYTVGSDIGKGLTVLELEHETPGTQNWETDEELGPYDVLEPTMQKPL